MKSAWLSLSFQGEGDASIGSKNKFELQFAVFEKENILCLLSPKTPPFPESSAEYTLWPTPLVWILNVIKRGRHCHWAIEVVPLLSCFTCLSPLCQNTRKHMGGNSGQVRSGEGRGRHSPGHHSRRKTVAGHPRGPHQSLRHTGHQPHAIDTGPQSL